MKLRRQTANVDYLKLLGTQFKALGNPNESYVIFIETLRRFMMTVSQKLNSK